MEEGKGERKGGRKGRVRKWNGRKGKEGGNGKERVEKEGTKGRYGEEIGRDVWSGANPYHNATKVGTKLHSDYGMLR